jgi:TolB-like protein
LKKEKMTTAKIFNITGAMLVAALALLAARSAAQTTPPKTQPLTIATMPLEASAGMSAQEAALLTSRLNSELVNDGTFRVVERAKVDALLQEMGLQQSGACDANECVVEVGKMLGVQLMVGGTVGRIGETYVIDTRMIAVSSGRIVRTTKDNYQGPIDGLLDVLQDVAKKLAGRQVAPRSATPIAPSRSRPVKPQPPKNDLNTDRIGRREWVQVTLGVGKNKPFASSYSYNDYFFGNYTDEFDGGESFSLRVTLPIYRNLRNTFNGRYFRVPYTETYTYYASYFDTTTKYSYSNKLNIFTITWNLVCQFDSRRQRLYFEAGSGIKLGDYDTTLTVLAGGGLQIHLTKFLSLDAEVIYMEIIGDPLSILHYSGGFGLRF